jgi:tight adherence protein B
MFSMGHLTVLVSLFFFMIGVVEIIPELFTLYRERYKADVAHTSRELDRFFLNVKPTHVLVGTVIVGILLGLFTGSWVLAITISTAGLIAPRIILWIYKEIRSNQLEAQLMDALILINNSLRSGLDIAAGIERVATTMKPPISEEFGLVLNSYRLGTQLETALIDITTRIRSRTLETVVYAVAIQRESGGNIIKTFDQLVLTIREESKLQKKVKAMTAQGRTQIFFLAGFPWLMAVGFFILSPGFIAPALASTWGQIVIVLLLVWEAIGIVVTKQIVTVDL